MSILGLIIILILNIILMLILLIFRKQFLTDYLNICEKAINVFGDINIEKILIYLLSFIICFLSSIIIFNVFLINMLKITFIIIFNILTNNKNKTIRIKKKKVDKNKYIYFLKKIFLEKPKRWAFLKTYNIIYFFKNRKITTRIERIVLTVFTLRNLFVNILYRITIGFSKNIFRRTNILKNTIIMSIKLTKNIKNWEKKNLKTKWKITLNYIMFNLLNKVYLEEENNILKKKILIKKKKIYLNPPKKFFETLNDLLTIINEINNKSEIKEADRIIREESFDVLIKKKNEVAHLSKMIELDNETIAIKNETTNPVYYIDDKKYISEEEHEGSLSKNVKKAYFNPTYTEKEENIRIGIIVNKYYNENQEQKSKLFRESILKDIINENNLLTHINKNKFESTKNNFLLIGLEQNNPGLRICFYVLDEYIKKNEKLFLEIENSGEYEKNLLKIAKDNIILFSTTENEKEINLKAVEILEKIYK